PPGSLECTATNPSGHDRDIYRNREEDRYVQGRQGSCTGLWSKRPCRGDPMPSSDQERWLSLGLPLGSRSQTCASRKRGARMNTLFAEGVDTMPEAVGQTSEVIAVVARIESLNWSQIANELNDQGSSVLKRVLTAEECIRLAKLYPNEDGFRSRIVMGRHGFGRGEYKYFSYPLPGIIQGMRTALYRELAPIANHWNKSMAIEVQYPKEH